MKTHLLIISVLTVIFLVIINTKSKAVQEAVTREIRNDRINDDFDNIGYTYFQKKDFIRNMRLEVDGLESDLFKLPQAEVAVDRQKIIAGIKKLHNQLDRFDNAPVENWNNMKEKFERSLKEVRNMFREDKIIED